MDQLTEITSLLAKYAFANDNNNVPMIGECFAEDAVFALDVHSSSDPTMYFHGRAEIEGLMTSSMESQNDVRRHFITNLRVLSIEKEQAKISSYLLLGVSESTGLRIVQSGLYEDDLVCTTTGLFIQHRHLTMDGTFA